MPEVIDLDARKTALEAGHAAAMALEKIESHTKWCEDASRRQERLAERLEKSIGRVHGRLDKLLYGVLAAVIMVVAQMVMKKLGVL